MKYTVLITKQANEELDAAFGWLVRQTEQHAPEWYNRILVALESLEQFPARCPLAPENEDSDQEVRHLIVGERAHGYRIVFVIRGSNVIVLDIVHGARDTS